MAQQPLTPPPNTPLVLGDPRADAIWRQWLSQQFVRVYSSSQIAHNSLADIQGGAAGEYYHLTSSQQALVTSLMHNNLPGLQGGAALQYYHLTEAQHALATSYQHNSLNFLQGGAALQYYHLTEAQHATVTSLQHNNLPGLQGGAALQYYHLTEAQHALATSYQHNSLNFLQGGAANDYYHLTGAYYASVTSFFAGGTLGANSVVYTNASGTVSSEAGFTYTETTNAMVVSSLTVSTISVTGLASGKLALTGAGGLLTETTSFSYTNTAINKALTINASGSAGVFLDINNAHASGDCFANIVANGTGDAYIGLIAGGGWYVGVDNSASDQFIIGTSQPGAADIVRIATSGAITLLGSVLVSSRISATSTYSASSFIALSLANPGTTASTEVAIDFAPNAAGAGVRSAQIASKSVLGGNENNLIFRTGSGEAPTDRATIDKSGNFVFCQTAGTVVRILPGIISASPVDGDIWHASSGALGVYTRVNGVTVPMSDPWTYLKVSAAHFATSTTAFVNIPGLTFAPGTNSTYEFEATLMMKTSTAATNPLIGVRWPTGTSSVGWINQGQTNSTQLFTWGNQMSTMQMGPGLLATTTAPWAVICGGLINAFGAAASSFGLQLASETNGVFVSTMIGSYLKYRVI